MKLKDLDYLVQLCLIRLKPNYAENKIFKTEHLYMIL